MAFLKVHNNVLHYQWHDQKRSKNIVLINSLGSNLMIWHAVLPILKKNFNVLLFDKRGHGLSATQKGKITIDDYADDVIALMDFCTIEKASIVGLSIGGLITYSLVSRYPERAEKLIFSNTGAKIGTKQTWAERIAAVNEKGLDAMAFAIIERWLSPKFRKEQSEATAGYTIMVTQNSSLGYTQACDAIAHANYSAVVKNIKNPTLFIGGSEDIGTTPNFVKEHASQIPNSTTHIIDGVGHLPCIEAPEIVAQYIQDFCLDDDTSLYDKGMKTRRSVLGNTHVDKAEANKTDFDTDFQEYIVNSAWGSIWSRPHLTKRERSMITIALLAALGHEEELAMHIRATQNTGATIEDVKEVLLHTGIYTGVPVTNGALKIAKEIIYNLKKEDE